jgi:hypothetical protein
VSCRGVPKRLNLVASGVVHARTRTARACGDDRSRSKLLACVRKAVAVPLLKGVPIAPHAWP